MASNRIGRISGDMQIVISDVMRDLKDPRITGMLSIVRVDVTNDLSYATVYVSSMDGLDAAKEAVKGLTHAGGFIKREIGSRLKMRKIPELRFVPDTSIAQGAEMAKRIKQLNEDDED